MNLKIFFGLMFILLVIPLAHSWEFDNINSFDKKIGNYGKYTVRNSILGIPFLQLDKIVEIELKENSEICSGFNCYAEKEIILYEDGVLIEDIRFINIKENSLTTIKHNLKIKKGKEWIDYNLGDEVNAGTYEVKLEGELPDIFTKIDWQIKSIGFWTTEWATWSNSLDVNILAYWDMTNDTLTNIPDLVSGTYNATIINLGGDTGIYMTDGIKGFAQTGLNWSTGAGDSGDGNHINVTNSFPNMTGLNRNFTVNMWFNTTTINTDHRGILSFSDEGFEIGTQGSFLSLQHPDVRDLAPDHTTNITNGSWHMLTAVVKQNGSIEMWVDGTINVNITSPTLPEDFEGTKHMVIGTTPAFNQPQNLTIDEVGIWNRTLSSDELIQLYNSGQGIVYGETLTELIFPVDNNITLTRTQNFQANITKIGDTTKNSTLYVWFSNNTELTNYTTLASIDTIISNLSFENLPHDSYQWNVFGCFDSGDCSFAISNFTLNVSNFVEDSITYNENSKSGLTETFILNISALESLTGSSFFYNNTEYPVSISSNGKKHSISSTIFIPLVQSLTNLSFYWIIDTTSLSKNSSSSNQEVSAINIDDCSTHSDILLNLTLRDEDGQYLLNGTTNNTEIQIDLSLSSVSTSEVIANFNQTYTIINPVAVCLDGINDSSYRLDSVISYETTDRVLEYYHLQNFLVTNSTIPQNISLYDLLSSRSTDFKIIFKDSNFLPVSDALISITKKYVGEGIFKTVEIGKTDTNGEAIGHLVVTDNIYTFIVSKNGVILATFENVIAVCENPLSSICTINLNQQTTVTPIQNFTTLKGVTKTLSFNEATRTISLLFTTLDGSAKNVSLFTFKFDRLGNTSVCSDTLVSSSGTLTCVIPTSIGNTTVIPKIYIDGSFEGQESFLLDESPFDRFGDDLGFVTVMAIIILISVPLMFMVDKMIMVIMFAVSFILVTSLYMIAGGGLFEIGGIFIYLFIMVAILIWRLSQRIET